MDGPLTDLEATMGTYQFWSYGGKQQDRRGDRAPSRHLTTWRPPWLLPTSLLCRRAVGKTVGHSCLSVRRRRDTNRRAGHSGEPTNFDPMVVSSREATVTRRRRNETASVTYNSFYRLYPVSKRCRRPSLVTQIDVAPLINLYVRHIAIYYINY